VYSAPIPFTTVAAGKQSAPSMHFAGFENDKNCAALACWKSAMWGFWLNQFALQIFGLTIFKNNVSLDESSLCFLALQTCSILKFLSSLHFLGIRNCTWHNSMVPNRKQRIEQDGNYRSVTRNFIVLMGMCCGTCVVFLYSCCHPHRFGQPISGWKLMKAGLLFVAQL